MSAGSSAAAAQPGGRHFLDARTPPQRSRHHEERPWKSYYTEMLLQHDSGSEYTTSYGTGSASPALYRGGGAAPLVSGGGGGCSGGGLWVSGSRSPSEEEEHCDDRHRDALALCATASTAAAFTPPSERCAGCAATMRKAGAISWPVAWTWVLLSTSVFGLCSFALTQPYWLVSGGGGGGGSRRRESLGVINCCSQIAAVNASAAMAAVAATAAVERCGPYGGVVDGTIVISGGWRLSVEGVPSLSWRTTLLLNACGCVALGLASVQAALCLCVPYKHRRRLSLVAGYFQLFSVILLITSLLTFPVGLDAPAVRAACGPSAGVYNGGGCSVGWSYALSITATALGIFCPVLSHYIESPS